MTASRVDRALEPAILDWLDLGPSEAPQRLSEGILDTVEITPQRHARLGLEPRSMRLLLVAAAVASIVAGVIVAGGWLDTPTPMPSVAPVPTAVSPPPSAAPGSPGASPADPQTALHDRFVPAIADRCDAPTLVAVAQAADLYRRVGVNIIPGSSPSGGLDATTEWTTNDVVVPRALVDCQGGALGTVRVRAVAFRPSDDSNENIVVAWPGTFFALPTGSCDGSEPAYGRWPSSGVPDGRVACWIASDGVAWVTWSDQRSRIVYLASRADGDLPALLVWWRETAPAWLGAGPV